MPRSQLFIFIGIGVSILIIFLIIGGFIFGPKSSVLQPATLEFWGIEDEEVWREAIAKFQEQNKHLTVNYTKFVEDSYEESLVNRLAEGRGPDVFLLENTWITKHRDKIFSLPRDVFAVNPRDINSAFVDLIADDLLLSDGTIFGLPVFVDTLAVFYNKDIFNAAGIAETPKKWDEIVSMSQNLTKLSPAGDILRSGIALGDARNVEYAPEIFTSIMLQNGEKLADRGTGEITMGIGANDALDFFVSFQDQKSNHFSWNARLSNSLDAFAEGKAAMAIGFSDDIVRIQAKNPHLNFGVFAFPQKESGKASVYGKYFFPTVSKLSGNQTASWQLVLFLASQEGAKSYLEKSGKPPARRDLISQKAPTTELEVFYKQTLIASSWRVPDAKRTRRLFEDAIQSATSKFASTGDIISRLTDQLRLLAP